MAWGQRGTGRCRGAGAVRHRRPFAVAGRGFIAPKGRIGFKTGSTLEDYARNMGIKSLYLLTNTAESFFKHRGYQSPRGTMHRGDRDRSFPSSPCEFGLHGKTPVAALSSAIQNYSDPFVLTLREIKHERKRVRKNTANGERSVCPGGGGRTLRMPGRACQFLLRFFDRHC